VLIWYKSSGIVLHKFDSLTAANGTISNIILFSTLQVLRNMKRQGLQNNQYKGFRSFSAGLAVTLLVSSGSLLTAVQVNARTDIQVKTTQNITAQAPATGTIIYVNPSSGSDAVGAGTTEAAPVKTITFALKQAQSGTVIQLLPGNYSTASGETFPLDLKSGVTLRGNDEAKGQGILITGGGSYTSRTFAQQNITILGQNNSTISGVTVTNPNQRGTAVWIESTNTVITNNTFTNSVREGVFVTGTGNPKVNNNIFVLNQGNGISIAKQSTGEVRGNMFQNTGFGIAVSETAAPMIADNQILQNNGGVVVTGSAKPMLRNNVIQDSRDHGLVAIQTAEPNLGTETDLGKNLIRNNGTKNTKTFFDVLNATKEQTITAVGNDIDPKRISGKVNLVVAQVDPPKGSGSFSDITANYWAKGYVEALASRNIIAGFPDGSFKPDEPVTRAQFAAIIAKAFNPAPKNPAIAFTDVKSDFWAYAVIQTVARGGFIAGYPDKTFKPQQQIPRVQALVALANGLGLTTDNKNIISYYGDAAQIPSYASSAIASATAKGLVVNYPTVKQLNPTRPATRAEVAAFVYQGLVSSGAAPAIASPYVVKTP
jgi:parallel beta-helix repeat protein